MLRFEYSVWINAPVDRVWAFHERDDIFDLLNPPDGSVKLLLRKGKLATGARSEFEVRVLGPIKVRWLALHVDYEPGKFFVDEQIRGPFKSWFHEHRFEPENGGTRMTDRIRCSLPLAPLSNWMAGWMVGLSLRKLFAHRHAVTKRTCEEQQVTA
jgi:ligand-binding SRPBCC domain-containing protein